MNRIEYSLKTMINNIKDFSRPEFFHFANTIVENYKKILISVSNKQKSKYMTSDNTYNMDLSNHVYISFRDINLYNTYSKKIKVGFLIDFLFPIIINLIEASYEYNDDINNKTFINIFIKNLDFKFINPETYMFKINNQEYILKIDLDEHDILEYTAFYKSISDIYDESDLKRIASMKLKLYIMFSYIVFKFALSKLEYDEVYKIFECIYKDMYFYDIIYNFIDQNKYLAKYVFLELGYSHIFDTNFSNITRYNSEVNFNILDLYSFIENITISDIDKGYCPISYENSAHNMFTILLNMAAMNIIKLDIEEIIFSRIDHSGLMKFIDKNTHKVIEIKQCVYMNKSFRHIFDGVDITSYLIKLLDNSKAFENAIKDRYIEIFNDLSHFGVASIVTPDNKLSIMNFFIKHIDKFKTLKDRRLIVKLIDKNIKVGAFIDNVYTLITDIDNNIDDYIDWGDFIRSDYLDKIKDYILLERIFAYNNFKYSEIYNILKYETINIAEYLYKYTPVYFMIKRNKLVKDHSILNRLYADKSNIIRFMNKFNYKYNLMFNVSNISTYLNLFIFKNMKFHLGKNEYLNVLDKIDEYCVNKIDIHKMKFNNKDMNKIVFYVGSHLFPLRLYTRIINKSDMYKEKNGNSIKFNKNDFRWLFTYMKVDNNRQS